jgi:regulator of protease activity HflC (stomatin/prohibitin superfamily)
VLFIYGDFVATLPFGCYVFWKNMAQVKFVKEDLREAMFDVASQDIMPGDKVTLRMNAVFTYRVIDARTAVSTLDDLPRALYREAQLALRGGRRPAHDTRPCTVLSCWSLPTRRLTSCWPTVSLA